MTVEYTVRVDDETAEQLSEQDSEAVKAALKNSLEDLAEYRNKVEDKQSELHYRMGIADSRDGLDSSDEELNDQELIEELQAFMRGERRKDPRLE